MSRGRLGGTMPLERAATATSPGRDPPAGEASRTGLCYRLG
jgi:hypothetical protein